MLSSYYYYFVHLHILYIYIFYSIIILFQLYINTEMCVNTLMYECTTFLVQHRSVVNYSKLSWSWIFLFSSEGKTAGIRAAEPHSNVTIIHWTTTLQPSGSKSILEFYKLTIISFKCRHEWLKNFRCELGHLKKKFLIFFSPSLNSTYLRDHSSELHSLHCRAKCWMISIYLLWGGCVNREINLLVITTNQPTSYQT